MENFTAILNGTAENVTIVTEPVLAEGYELTLPQYFLTQEEMSKRILGFVTEKQQYTRLKALIPSKLPENEKNFSKSCTESVWYNTRVYSLQGHTTRVLVPEEYAQKLDIVRQRRLGQIDLLPENMIGYLNRVLPEDVLAILDELPNRSYIKEISLVDWLNPRDVWIRALRKSETFTSAASTTPDGQVLLYRFDVSEFLGTTIFHEWNHVLQAKFMKQVKLAWDSAINMEWFVWVNNDYAKVSPGEHWAVFGEAILQKDGPRFAQVASSLGPMRTMVWATALGKALDAVPVADRSCYHDIWVARVAYALKNAATPARTNAAKMLRRARRLDAYLKALPATEPAAAA